MSGHAFVLRMIPLGIDRVPIGRQTGEISIGWGRVGDVLLDSRLDRLTFARVVHDTYYGGAPNRLGSGSATGQLWRFIRVMSLDDLILVPHWGELHLARVTGDPRHDPNPNAEHWSYRRPVEWLTRSRGLDRYQQDDQIQAAARTRLTCIEVSHLRRELERVAQ